MQLAGVLALLLAAQLALAAELCRATPDMAVTFQAACQDSPDASSACFSASTRVLAGAPARAGQSRNSPPGADMPHLARPIALAALQPRPSAGTDPGFGAPLYIRFGRFLS